MFRYTTKGVYFLFAVTTPIFSQLTAKADDKTRSDYIRLLDDIQSYPSVVKKVPPTISGTNSKSKLPVTVTFIPYEVVELDHSREVLVTTSEITFSWTDSNLAWNPDSYGGIEAVELAADSLWTPLIMVKNAVTDHAIQASQMGAIVLHSDGQVRVSVARRIETTCLIDFAHYPFDVQQCSVIFYSTSLHGISLEKAKAGVNEFQDHFPKGGEWKFLSISLSEETQLAYNRTYLEFVLHLKRKTQFYIVGLITPLILFTFTNCMVFLIPPESGEKVSFLVSLFISNAIFSSYVNDVMPRGLVEVPHLMMHIVIMWITSLLTILATIFVLRRFHDEKKQWDCDMSQNGGLTKSHDMYRQTELVKIPGLLQCSTQSQVEKTTTQQLLCCQLRRSKAEDLWSMVPQPVARLCQRLLAWQTAEQMDRGLFVLAFLETLTANIILLYSITTDT